MWLLDLDDATIVPLARRDRGMPGRAQANPLYDGPPDGALCGGPRTQCVEAHCSYALLGSDFRIAYAFGAHFLCAKVLSYAPYGDPTEVYINIWSGRSL